MQWTRWIVALAALGLAAPVQAESKDFELDEGKTVLKPITYKNLTLFPVVAKKKTTSKYIILDDGMKAGKVKVVEKGDGGNVSQLTIDNTSDEPLFLMAGEVIIGGKQDRIIGKNTVVPAKAKQAVPVFCVEHGRWGGRKATFESANTLAHTKLRNSASFSTQSEVWKEVKAKNEMRDEDNATDTYRRVATGKAVKKTISGYKSFFAKKLGKLNQSSDMVGFVVALNGKVVAIEVFGSSDLFHKLEKKILASYYVQAVDEAQPKKKPKAPSAKAIKAFRKKAKSAKRKVVYDSKGAKTYQFDESDIQGSAVAADEDAPAVYESTYAK